MTDNMNSDDILLLSDGLSRVEARVTSLETKLTEGFAKMDSMYTKLEKYFMKKKKRKQVSGNPKPVETTVKVADVAEGEATTDEEVDLIIPSSIHTTTENLDSIVPLFCFEEATPTKIDSIEEAKDFKIMGGVQIDEKHCNQLETSLEFFVLCNKFNCKDCFGSNFDDSRPIYDRGKHSQSSSMSSGKIIARFTRCFGFSSELRFIGQNGFLGGNYAVFLHASNLFGKMLVRSTATWITVLPQLLRKNELDKYDFLHLFFILSVYDRGREFNPLGVCFWISVKDSDFCPFVLNKECPVRMDVCNSKFVYKLFVLHEYQYNFLLTSLGVLLLVTKGKTSMDGMLFMEMPENVAVTMGVGKGELIVQLGRSKVSHKLLVHDHPFLTIESTRKSFDRGKVLRYFYLAAHDYLLENVNFLSLQLVIVFVITRYSSASDRGKQCTLLMIFSSLAGDYNILSVWEVLNSSAANSTSGKRLGKILQKVSVVWCWITGGICFPAHLGYIRYLFDRAVILHGYFCKVIITILWFCSLFPCSNFLAIPNGEMVQKLVPGIEDDNRKQFDGSKYRGDFTGEFAFKVFKISWFQAGGNGDVKLWSMEFFDHVLDVGGEAIFCLQLKCGLIILPVNSQGSLDINLYYECFLPIFEFVSCDTYTIKHHRLCQLQSDVLLILFSCDSRVCLKMSTFCWVVLTMCSKLLTRSTGNAVSQLVPPHVCLFMVMDGLTLNKCDLISENQWGFIIFIASSHSSGATDWSVRGFMLFSAQELKKDMHDRVDETILTSEKVHMYSAMIGFLSLCFAPSESSYICCHLYLLCLMYQPVRGCSKCENYETKIVLQFFLLVCRIQTVYLMLWGYLRWKFRWITSFTAVTKILLGFFRESAILESGKRLQVVFIEVCCTLLSFWIVFSRWKFKFFPTGWSVKSVSWLYMGFSSSWCFKGEDLKHGIDTLLATITDKVYTTVLEQLDVGVQKLHHSVSPTGCELVGKLGRIVATTVRISEIQGSECLRHLTGVCFTLVLVWATTVQDLLVGFMVSTVRAGVLELLVYSAVTTTRLKAAPGSRETVQELRVSASSSPAVPHLIDNPVQLDSERLDSRQIMVGVVRKKWTAWQSQRRDDSHTPSTMPVHMSGSANKSFFFHACEVPLNKDREQSLTIIARAGDTLLLWIITFTISSSVRLARIAARFFILEDKDVLMEKGLSYA